MEVSMERTEEDKQARMVGQSWNMADLPLHILIEIISRLPIKTVIAISCVCKSLLSLVSDSHFQMLHSTRSPTELMVSTTLPSSTTLCTAEYVFQDDSLTAVDGESNVVFDLPRFSIGSDNCRDFESTWTIVSLVNSCYGLVCFTGPYRRRFAVICNPFTREYITFPCPAKIDKNVKKGSIYYGLGFSHKDNSFKLLRMMYHNNVDACVCEVYTFGERGSSWKMVANSPHVHMTGTEEAIFHEGALHWYCTHDDVILTFDFDTELFGKLVTPPRVGDLSSSEVRWSLAMGVFENCLYTTGCVGDYVDIWALKEYDQGNWVKIFSIQKDVKIFSESYQPFKYLQNGQVLMYKKSGVGIVCFNPDTESVENVGGYSGRNRAVFIRPSLVSLKVLLGDNAKIHSVKPWERKKVAAISRSWISSDVVKADKDSQGCVPSSSAPRDSSEASASTSHPIEEKVKEDAVPVILESQQSGAETGSFGSQDSRPPKDRHVGQSSSETQKPADAIETLKAENVQKVKQLKP